MRKAVVTKKRPALLLWIMCLAALVFSLFYGPAPSHAADSLCAEVKIEIKQELTLERQAFDAHMRIKNGLFHIAIKDVSVAVKFTDADGNTVLATSDPDDASARFFIRVDTMTNISDVSGVGKVAPSTTADIHWLIIPAPGASNGLESGTLYYVGATLSYTIGGEANQTVVVPDYIYVKPMPEITLDYFLPSEVYGDDAFTQAIEPAVPFSLGVRVNNSGHGTARKLKIESAQPQITENEQGLLIGFAIVGSQVNGKPVTDTLLIDFGDIAPSTSATARWIMTCSLSGRFVKFDADFSHSNELGGAVTSLINAVETHFLVHDVWVDLAGRDQILDFLAKDGDFYRVYESESMESPVTDQSGASSLSYIGTQNDRPAYKLTTPINVGFMYVKLPDPYNGSKTIHSAVRADGKTIKSENIWLSKSRKGQDWDYFINLFDVAGTSDYTVVFADPVASPQAPVLQHIDDLLAVEGNRISFMVQASDPDTTLPVLSAAMLPAGAAFTDRGDGTAIFDWTPAIGQAGSYRIAFTASDGKLTATQRVNFTIRSIDDTDGDGMNDSWELAQFGSLDRDSSGDFDHDGISDLDEYLSGSDPKSENHAPTVPVIAAPSLGEWVTSLTPNLVIENSTDADSHEISYEFEVYADSQLTWLTSADLVEAAATVTTTWRLSEELVENQHYFWRVRATDGQSYSLWAYGDFIVDTTNDPPADPAISFPPDGVNVDTLTPILEVTGATDPDEKDLTCAFEVYADAAMTVPIADMHGLLIPDDGVVRWKVNQSLNNGAVYFWRALVSDSQGLVSETDAAVFTVNTVNHAPSAPVINLPADSGEVSTTNVDLTITNSTDADYDAVFYFFEIDTVPGFDSVNKQISPLIGQDQDTTQWSVSNLKDNTAYYWRVMATDKSAPSPWTTGHFFVNSANQSPSASTVKNPGQAAWAGVLTPELSITNSLDIDRDSLTYRYEVYTEPMLINLVAWGETTATQWTVVTDLTDKTRYYWRARATDEHGAVGTWMPTAFFFVNQEEQLPPEAIEVTVSTNKGRAIENIKVYAFTAAGAYANINATSRSDGKAIFDIDAFSPAAYKFRADYMGSQFWSDTISIPQTAVISLIIDEENVAVTINTGTGTAAGVRVYLFSATGSYLGQYLTTDVNGQVFFNLPSGKTYLFQADILGSRYWSGTTTVSSGVNAVAVAAGGGRLQATVQQNESTPMPGLRVYLFSSKGSYLNIYGTTDDSGTVGFNVTEADYLLRIDYLGYQFWSEVMHVVTDTTEAIEMAHQPAELTVQGRFQDIITPVAGIKTYLFSAAGAYLSQTLSTDTDGQAEFNLPKKEYKFRADYLGKQYWSQAFTWDDPLITIPLADARVSVSGAGLPKQGVKVYLYSMSGSYLGLNKTTDSNGQVTFRLPEDQYDFRADYQNSNFWVQDRILTADVVTDVDISVGGGTFQLSLKTDDDRPLAGVKCHVFNQNDVYLGLSAATAETGIISFDLANGDYRFRATYLGHEFLSETVTVTGNSGHEMIIAESPVPVDVIAAQAPVTGVRVHLFSSSGSYLNRYEVTDVNGRVLFNLPTGITFRFRVDLLGGQYWSEDVVVSDSGVPVMVDTGGGRMTVTVATATQSPFSGLNVYLFRENGQYLGLLKKTGADGRVEFSVPEGTYRVRTDYLGYSFWQENIQVLSDTHVALVIPLSAVTISVVGSYQGLDTALAGIPVYLFTPTGAYLGLSAETDEQGLVTFHLPEKSYMVRTDYTASQYWSEPFAWGDPTVRIPMADAEVTVTGVGLPSAGVKVYLFSSENAYLGQVRSTNEDGIVRFYLPAQSYKFRADYQAESLLEQRYTACCRCGKPRADQRWRRELRVDHRKGWWCSHGRYQYLCLCRKRRISGVKRWDRRKWASLLCAG